MDNDVNVSLDEPGATGCDLEIALPPRNLSLAQDQEWCVVFWEGAWHKVFIHDYAAIYAIPGLYERLLGDVLGCRSPHTVRSLLESELARSRTRPQDLRVLDLGAGNGMVGEELADMGVTSITGLDIIDAAAGAAARDRPAVYEDYYVVDMAHLGPEDRERLLGKRPNCLVCVAALGFNDIPTGAFVNAYDLVQLGGWVTFNIKEEFLGEGDDSGFSRLLRSMTAGGALEIRARRRYRHRLGTDGSPLHYVAVVGIKRAEAPGTQWGTGNPS